MCFEEFVHSFSSFVIAPKLPYSTVDSRVSKKEPVPSFLILEVNNHHLAAGNLISPVAKSIQNWLIGRGIDIAIVIRPGFTMLVRIS
jgi:hypothetical protein